MLCQNALTRFVPSVGITMTTILGPVLAQHVSFSLSITQAILHQNFQIIPYNMYKIQTGIVYCTIEMWITLQAALLKCEAFQSCSIEMWITFQFLSRSCNIEMWILFYSLMLFNALLPSTSVVEVKEMVQSVCPSDIKFYQPQSKGDNMFGSICL